MFPFLDDIDIFVLIHSPTENPLCIWAFDRLFQRYLSKDPLKKNYHSWFYFVALLVISRWEGVVYGKVVLFL